MTQGRTVLIIKDPEKGTSPGNYRPMTCLPVMWKLLTGIISGEMYSFLDKEGLLPEEQKLRAAEGVHREQMTSCTLILEYLEKVNHAKRTWPWVG